MGEKTRFLYFRGTVKGDNQWTYDLEMKFHEQLAAQPQYKDMTEINATSSIPEGAYHIANMAIGLADDDYRTEYPPEGDNPTEFGEWVDKNRQEIYNDAAEWFEE